jgi:hypothetical protein
VNKTGVLNEEVKLGRVLPVVFVVHAQIHTNLLVRTLRGSLKRRGRWEPRRRSASRHWTPTPPERSN